MESTLLFFDNDFQYIHRDFKRRVTKAAMTHSMPRVGRCIDHNPLESFFGTLQNEKFHLKNIKHLNNFGQRYMHTYRYKKRLIGFSSVEYGTKIT